MSKSNEALERTNLLAINDQELSLDSGIIQTKPEKRQDTSDTAVKEVRMMLPRNGIFRWG